jgi:hypothetical protein
MIRHYRGQLTLRYLPVRYEALIEDPGAVLRQILPFIGAGAEVPADAELRANRRNSAGFVPEHAVVQEPIHARGLNGAERAAAVAPHLFAEVRQILAEWIEALGYGA